MQWLTNKSFYITFLLIVFALLQLNAQYAEERKHIFNIEAAGRSFAFGTLNYEFMPHDKFSFGLGAGFMFREKYTTSNFNNNLIERGEKTRIATSQVIFGNYFIGKQQHKLQLTAGLTHFWELEKWDLPSGIQKNQVSDFKWNLGLGYQVSFKRSIFRVTGYRIALPSNVNGTVENIPWLGITYGVRL